MLAPIMRKTTLDEYPTTTLRWHRSPIRLLRGITSGKPALKSIMHPRHTTDQHRPTSLSHTAPSRRLHRARRTTLHKHIIRITFPPHPPLHTFILKRTHMSRPRHTLRLLPQHLPMALRRHIYCLRTLPPSLSQMDICLWTIRQPMAPLPTQPSSSANFCSI